MSHVFEIVIRRRLGKGKQWPVVIDWRRPADTPVRVSGTFSYNSIELLQKIVPNTYGEYLGSRIFSPPILRALDRAFSKSNQNLRVLLTIEDETLRGLRWERLCAPLDDERWSFLARNQRTPFAFHLPSAIDRSFPMIDRADLRALVLVATPTSPNGLKQDWGLDEFDPQIAVDTVLQGLQDIPADVLATVPCAVGPPTLDALTEKLSGHFYPLLHIVAHGKLTAGDIALFLANEVDNSVDRVIGERLLSRMDTLSNQRRMPHFVFLATCSSASPELETADAVGGIAQRLVRDLGIPAVLAMTDLVQVKTATILSEYFYRHLKDHGEVDRALAEACASLGDQYDFTVPALFSRLGERALFSNVLDRSLNDNELRTGLCQLAQLIGERAPVLKLALAEMLRDAKLDQLINLDEHRRLVLKSDLTKLLTNPDPTPARLDRLNLVSLDHLCREVVPGLGFADLARGIEPPPYVSVSPFPGLLPFREQHEEQFFFGRDEEIRLLDQRIRRQQSGLIPITGSSGTGKSSLVYAGLLPRLRKRGTTLLSMTPGSDPVTHLDSLRSNLLSIPAVLLIDQFEELFTLNADTAGLERRQHFIERMAEVASRRVVILTMRADFCGDCASYPVLNRMLRSQLLLAPINAEQLHEVMLAQADKAGLVFEAGLSSRILDDVRGEPGAMPLLQHALRELWERRRGPYLRTIEYDAIDGVRGAIARTADQVFEERLNGEQRSIMKHVFLRLTRADIEALPGEERRDTRRRVPRYELVPAHGDQNTTFQLIDELATTRLLVTSENVMTGEREVEIAHEALIRHWGRLREWLDQDRQIARLREQITREAGDWERSGKHEDYLLLRGRRMADLQAELARQELTFDDLSLNAPEMEYVQESVSLPARKETEAARAREVLAEVTSSQISNVQAVSSAVPVTGDFDPVIDLEYRFRLPEPNQIVVDVTLRSPNSAAPSQLVYNAPIELDFQGLLAASLDPKLYGRKLSAMLFASPEMRDSWLRARAFAASKTLRLVLQFTTGDWSLPKLQWELLTDPETGLPLIQLERVSLVRTTTIADLRPLVIPSRNTLRLVVVAAAPLNAADFGLATLDTTSIFGTVASSATDLPMVALGGVEDRPATLQQILAELRASPVILYLSGHTRIVDGRSFIFLENESRGAQPTPLSEIAEMIAQLAQPPVLVVLVGSGDYADSTVEFQQMAPDLIAKGVPVVLTLDGSLSVSEHNQFIMTFFQALFQTSRPEHALAEARKELAANNLTWWKPLLYMRSGVEQIWSHKTQPRQSVDVSPVLFQIQLQRSGDRYSIRTSLGRGQDHQRPVLTTNLPVQVKFEGDTLASVSLDHEQYAQRLSALFFADEQLRLSYAKAQTVAFERGVPLLVQLSFGSPEPDKSWSSIRWELLNELETQQPLFTSQRVLATRVLHRNSARLADPVARPLRGLFIQAYHSEQNNYNMRMTEQISHFFDAFQRFTDNTSGLERVFTEQEVLNTLRVKQPDVYCLGVNVVETDSGETFVVLLGDDDRITRINSKKFAEGLRSLEDLPFLTILVTDNGFSLAQDVALISGGYVIGFQRGIPANAVEQFLATLFNELQRDGWIERAVAAARADLRASQWGSDWWRPVLFSPAIPELLPVGGSS